MKLAAVLVFAVATIAHGQTASRRLTTIDAVRAYPGFYHLQNVLLRGELTEGGLAADAPAPDAPRSAAPQLMLKADEQQLRAVLDAGVSTARGNVEVRGHIIDVGRLERNDPRLAGVVERLESDRWPKPGEELFVRVTSVTEAQPPLAVSIRALALEPWRYEGQTVTLLGNFRGRNLFGDQPGAPAKSNYDFVLRGAEGSIWVTGLRPRGRGFELDIDRRLDTASWIEVTGTVAHEKGLVRLEGTSLAMSKVPDVKPVAEEEGPPVPKLPAQVVFSTPTEGETDVPTGETIRIQFSRGLNEKSLAGRTRATLLGAAADAPPLAHKTTYDAATRSITITFAERLPAFRTVRLEILDGLLAFDDAPVTPWTLTFTVGG
jgi:hypothetical protein